MHRIVLSVLLFPVAGIATTSASEFAGHWSFSLPDGNPAWLAIEKADSGWEGHLLWSVGTAKPVEDVTIDDGALSFTRTLKWKPYGEDPALRIETPMTGRLDGDSLVLTVRQKRVDSPEAEEETISLHGKRLPELPEAPDLDEIVFGEEIDLLADGIAGWRLTNPKKTNGWRVESGVLINETPKKGHGAYGSYGNLRTNEEFDDFQLTIEYRLPDGGNSGIYLQGKYEAQVVDAAGKPPSKTGPGSIYGRLQPARNAARSAGEWNRYDLTLVDRHVTVVLNGDTVIENEPIEGPTGGGMSADVTTPGPLFLQGDHTTVEYRNILIRPRVK